ncbi:MAG: ArdC family protein [Methanobacterium sp.]|nr:ArdC family protein [Methanobacterium sp.]
MEIPKELKGKALGDWMYEQLNILCDSICQDPKELETFVNRWKLGFHNYSLKNTILIILQKPEALENPLIAGYKHWNSLGRQVKKGALSIKILAPAKKRIEDENGDETFIIKGFFPVSVFHISQTSKIDSKSEENLLDSIGCPDLISGDVDFETIAKACPYPIKIQDSLGFSNGNTDGKTINLANKSNKASLASTALHEWAHIELGHCQDKGILFETEERSAKEISAETVNFICCSALGITNQKSRLYIGNWGGNREELKSQGTKIISVSESIIRAISSV